MAVLLETICQNRQKAGKNGMGKYPTTGCGAESGRDCRTTEKYNVGLMEYRKQKESRKERKNMVAELSREIETGQSLITDSTDI